MKKSLLAVTLGAALAGLSVSAGAAEVQVYGLIDTSLSYVHSDADRPGIDSTDSLTMENAKEFGSRFGIKGSEDLGNGYKVGFVLESGFKSDDGSFDQKEKFFGRESHVDVHAPWGKLSFGLMPVFGSTLGADGLFRAIDPLFANYTVAFGSGMVTASSWTRVDNAVSYVSPTFAGFTGYAMYSFKNSTTVGGTEGHGGESDRYAALGARYLNGPLELVLLGDTTMYGSYRQDEASKDDGWTVTFGGNYSLENGVKFLAFTQFFGNMELNTTVRSGVGKDGIRDITQGAGYGFVDGYGVSLGVNVPAGNGVLKAALAYRDMDNQKNTDFTRWVASAGYDYPLSKRTAVYVMGGYSQEKVELQSGDSAKPSGYELTSGIVHRF